jgi:hypothetical protein
MRKLLLTAALVLSGCGSLTPERDVRLALSEGQSQMKLAIIREDWPAFERAMTEFRTKYELAAGQTPHLERFLEIVRREGELMFDAVKTGNGEKYTEEYEKMRPEKQALAELLMLQVQRSQIAADRRRELLRALNSGQAPPIPQYGTSQPTGLGFMCTSLTLLLISLVCLAYIWRQYYDYKTRQEAWEICWKWAYDELPNG